MLRLIQLSRLACHGLSAHFAGCAWHSPIKTLPIQQPFVPTSPPSQQATDSELAADFFGNRTRLPSELELPPINLPPCNCSKPVAHTGDRLGAGGRLLRQPHPYVVRSAGRRGRGARGPHL